MDIGRGVCVDIGYIPGDVLSPRLGAERRPIPAFAITAEETRGLFQAGHVFCLESSPNDNNRSWRIGG